MLAFAAERKLLIDELSIVIKAVETKSTIPILCNVLIESLQTGTVKLTATDLEIGITSVIHPLKLARDGSITLPAKALLNALKKLDGENATLLVEENRCAIVCEAATVRLEGMSRESYPELPQPKTPPAVVMQATDLNLLIARTSFAISHEENRFTLNGALMESNGTTRMVATDGHRLAFAELPIKSRKDFKVLIPTKGIRLIQFITGKNSDTTVLVSSDDSHVYFTADDRQLICRKLTGNFPDYERVMPKDLPVSAVIPREACVTVKQPVMLVRGGNLNRT